mgnify:CR=1 FL=1
MKLTNLLLFAGAAAASYHLVKNREDITEEVSETSQLLKKAQVSLANIQANYLKNQKETLEDISKDLQYKVKVFNQEAHARLTEIQQIWENPSNNK